jgi:ParB-like chromosome segregation protein Spo0J
MMRDMVASPDAADAGTRSGIGTVTAEYIAADLRPLAWPVDDLQPAPDNARLHDDADLSALADGLRLDKQQKPVVAKQHYRGLSNVVIAGNGTLQAARRLGWSHLAVTWFHGTDDEAREYAIRDNRLAELSNWSVSQLAALQAEGVDLLALWHDDAALADLLRESTPPPTFSPIEAEHQLDQLQPHCRTCTCRQEAKS